VQDRNRHKKGGYIVHVFTWLGLLVLTAVTVTVAGVGTGTLAVLITLGIAAVKSGFVLGTFMHLEHEARLFRVIVLVVIVTIAIFIGLTFVDVSFR